MLRHETIWPTILAAGALASVVAGCSSKPTYEFDELDSTPTQDEMIEFSLGKYAIPIPLTDPRGLDANAKKRNRIEFSFELYALVTADDEPQLDDMWKRHEGTIRDRIIRVCRNATLDELQEPELATLKSHLTDAVQSELGAKYVRRFLVAEAETRKL